MTKQFYRLCETKKEASGLLRAIAKLFGLPNADLLTDDQDQLILPEVQVQIRMSQATDVAKPVQMFITASHEGHLARVKATLTRRKSRRIAWPPKKLAN